MMLKKQDILYLKNNLLIDYSIDKKKFSDFNPKTLYTRYMSGHNKIKEINNVSALTFIF